MAHGRHAFLADGGRGALIASVGPGYKEACGLLKL